MSFTFSILAGDKVIGTLPHAAVLNGSTDLGDLINSWVTYTNRSLVQQPVSPTVLAITPALVTHLSGMADGFRVDQFEEEDHGDEVVMFRGKRYYLVDHDIHDHGYVEVQLQEADLVDEQRALLAKDPQTENLEHLTKFINGFMQEALAKAALQTVMLNGGIGKQPVGNVGVTLPVQPIAPVTKIPGGMPDAWAKPAVQTPPQVAGTASPATQTPIQGAINALQALLAK